MMEKKSKFQNRYVYLGLTAFIVIAACVLFFFILYRFASIMAYVSKLVSVLQPVIIGFIIAYLVNPLADSIRAGLLKLVKKRLKNNTFAVKVANAAGVFGALAVFICVLFLLIYMVVPQFLQSMTTLAKTVPAQLDTLIAKISHELNKNSELQEILISIYEYGKNWLQTDLTAYATSLATYFASSVWGVVSFMKNFAIGLIFALYLLFNKRVLIRQFRKLLFALFQVETVSHLVHTGRRANRIFSGFIYGKLLDSFIIGVLCFIGVTVMQMPYTMLVAVIIGVTNVIPVFGPYLGAVPCAALILLFNPMKGLSFIVFIILLQALDGNFIGPKILGNSTGLTAFWVVFAIVVAGGLFGVFGMLVGVPLFAVLYFLITEFVNFRLYNKELPVPNTFYDESVLQKISGSEKAEPQLNSENSRTNGETL